MLSYYCRSLLLSSLLVSTALAYDCQVGCYWDSNKDVTVCGEDKNVYPNECFAICQNVTIVKTGSCDDDIKTESASARKSQNSTNSALTTSVLIPINKMRQHDGYKLIRKYKDSELQGQVHMPVLNEEMMAKFKNQKSSSEKKQSTITPLMLDSEGYEYIGTATTTMKTQGVELEGLRSVPGYIPDHDGNNTTDNHHIRSRQLNVIGRDNRKMIKNTKAYPYSAVGRLGYDPDNGVCTGTVISRSAVLTAAHCVYDRDQQQWDKVTYFAPGRGYNGQVDNDPYGRWPVQIIVMPGEYPTDGTAVTDYAVITLGPNSNGQYIGDVVGYVGLDEVSGFDDTDLDRSAVTGYPADKSGGTMWTTGLCPGGFVSGESYGYDPNYIALDKCDITGGTSGSAFMRLKGVVNKDYRARGVNTFGFTISSTDGSTDWNGGNYFKQGNGLYDAILSWSGR